MGGKNKKYIEMFGSFMEPFNLQLSRVGAWLLLYFTALLLYTVVSKYETIYS